MTYYINPECMPYYYDHNKTKIVKDCTKQTIAYTADGFLLPCCWCDAPSTRKDIEKLNLYKKELKLSENSSIESILNSQEWKSFIDIIMHDPELAPRCCKEKCGVSNE